MKWKNIRFLVVGLCLFLLILPQPVILAESISTFGEEEEKNTLFVSKEGKIEETIKEEDIKILQEYPDAYLIQTNAKQEGLFQSDEINMMSTLPDRNLINVYGETVDITEPELDFDPNLVGQDYDDGEEGGHLVSMIGPVHQDWRRAIEELDAEIVNYHPNYAYEVLMDSNTAEKVESLDFVDQVDVFHPGFKMPNNVEGGEVMVSYYDGRSEFRNITNREEMIRLAQKRDVSNIEEYHEPELYDEMATQIIGGGLWIDDPDDDPDSPFRGYGEYGSMANQLGYTGEDVVVAVADTGLGDGTTPDGGHPDFAGRILGGYDYESGSFEEGEWDDNIGHGTHVTGSVGGDTYHGTGETIYEDYYAGQGSAPGSEFYVVKIFTEDDGFVGPSDYHEIIEIPAQQEDAYVHSNSWGAPTDGLYYYSDSDFDAAVRDANRDTEKNEPMVITASAGNSGSGSNTIGSPGNAKNVITVGATENYNPDLRSYDPESIASFSSRGWTNDNRVKPDVVAPGEDVASTYLDEGYDVASGTSMSNPAVAGSASVIVEWYEENYGEIPAPSLVRGLLINTAYSLENNQRNTLENTPHIPNQDEGWGMVNLPKVVDSDVNIFNINEEKTIETGEIEKHEIMVDDPSEPLNITLTWTDKEGEPGDEWTLKNNLNLEVLSPCGKRYRGNNLRESWSVAGPSTYDSFDVSGDGWDDVNNVQNVFIPPDDIEEGTYEVWVSGHNVPVDGTNDGNIDQDYSLVGHNAVADHPWPSYSMDEKNRGRSRFDASHITSEKEWTFETDEGIGTSSTVSQDGTIFFGTVGGYLYALNPDGTQKWSHDIGSPIYSTPAIGLDGTVYLGSHDNNVHAIYPDGTEKWQFSTGGNIDSDPVIGTEGTIYIGSQDNNLYAIHPNGTERWRFETDDSVHSSPAIDAEGNIYIGSDDNNLYALNPNGTENWKFETGGSVRSAPAIGEEYVYAGSSDNNLYALDFEGEKSWVFEAEDSVQSPSVSDDSVYMGSSDGYLHALSKDGSLRWDFKIGETGIDSTPVLGRNENIFIGSIDNDFYSLGKDGVENWKAGLNGSVRSASIGGDGGVYVGTASGDSNTGTLNAFRGDLNADFSWIPEDAMVDREIQFRDESTRGESDIVQREWDFDDGNSSDALNPIHTYEDEGYYNVTLEIMDEDGNEDSISYLVNVTYYEPPKANFTFSPENTLTGETVEFTDESERGSHNISYMEWDFGDGSTSSKENPENSYNVGGVYEVSLYIEDERSYSDSLTRTVNVSDDHVYSFDEEKMIKISSRGNSIWTHDINHSEVVTDVAVDPEGSNIYTSCSNASIRKYEDEGVSVGEVWNITLSESKIPALTVGPERYIYAASDDGEFYKINQGGDVEWNHNVHDHKITGLAVDDNSIHTIDVSGRYIRSNEEGEELASMYTGSELTSVKTSDEGYVMIGGYPDGHGNTLFHVDQHGNVIWANDVYDGKVEDIQMDHDSNVYAIGDNGTLRKFEDDGSLEWGYESENLDSNLALSPDGEIFTTSNEDEKVFKYIPEENEFEWEYSLKDKPMHIIHRAAPPSSFPRYWERSLKETPWPVPGYDVRRTSQSPYNTSHLEGSKLWNFDIGDSVSRSNPVIDDDGTIYVGSNDGHLYAIHQNGTQKWRFEMDEDTYFRGSVAISEGGSVVAISQTRPYTVYFLNHSDGSVEWSVPAGGSNSLGPTIYDGVVYYSSYSNVLHAVDIEKQERIWDFGDSSMPSHSTPAVGEDGTIYIGDTDNHLYAVNPDGTEKWRYETGDWVNTAPVVGDDGTIYFASRDYQLYALNPNGTEKWVYDEPYVYMGGSSPALSNDGIIYVGCIDGNLVAIDSETGEENWRWSERRAINTNPAIGSDGMLYVGTDYTSGVGYIRAIHTEKTEGEAGEVKWSYKAEDEMKSSPAVSNEGDVYIGSDDGRLYAFGEEHTLSIDSSEGGEVNTPGEGTFTIKHGREVEIEARPEEEEFIGWTGDIDSNDNKTTITMDDDKEIEALFGESYELTIDVEGEGSTDPASGTHTYEGGSEINVSAIQTKEHWSFEQWTGDISSKDEEITLTMNENKNITAQFTENEYVLSTSVEGDGGVEIEPEKEFYEPEEKVTLTASPEYHWTFVKWEGDIDGTENHTTIIMDEDKEVTAVFEKKKYYLNTNVEGDGEIDIEPDKKEYEALSEVNLTAISGEGHSFVAWEGDHNDKEQEISLVMDENKNITAIFEEDTYTINRNVDGKGAIALEPEKQEYTHGEEVGVLAVPEQHWRFVGWDGDVEGNERETTLLMDEDKNITAIFEEKRYTLNVSTNGDGMVEIQPEKEEYEPEEEVTLIADSDDHSTFTGWTGDVGSYEKEIDIVMDENKSVTANFEDIYYTLNVDVDGEGSVDIDPEREEYKHGEDVNLTASGDEHWYFVSWGGDHGGEDRNTTITMDENKTIIAFFEMYEYSLDVEYDEDEGNVEIDPEQDKYDPKTIVELSATPENHTEFVGWSGDYEGTTETISIVIDDDKNITAHFSTKTYTLDVSIEEGGEVDISPERDVYEHGEEVTLSASSAKGYTFISYTGDYECSEKYTSFNITEDKEISAVFEINTYHLSVDVVGEGEVEVDPEKNEYDHGTGVNLTAMSDEYWYFVGWSGDVEEGNESIKVIMEENITLVAEFSIYEYSLDVDVEGDGSVDIEPEEDMYEHGAVVYISAIANNHWSFAEWGGINNSGSDIVLEMVEDKEITAIFHENRYSLDIDVEGMGEVNVSPDKNEYEPESEVILAAESEEHWVFVEWEQDLRSSEDKITLIMDENKELTAIFEEKTYHLNITEIGEGFVDVDPFKGEYSPNEVVNLTAHPAEGWYFDTWSGDKNGTENTTSLVITENTSITAVFEEKTYAVNITSDGPGSVVISPEKEEFKHGVLVELTASPDEGAHFVGWNGYRDTDEKHLSIIVSSDIDITAEFENNTYQVEVDIEGLGSVELDPEREEYEHGEEVNLSADPDEHWYFAGWSGNYGGYHPEITIVIEEDVHLTAGFKEETYSLSVFGFGSGSVAMNPEKEEYARGTDVEVTAFPAEGWVFVRWDGDVEGRANSINITMDDDKQVIAVFEEKQYEVDVSIEGQGHVDIHPESSFYENGDALYLEAVPYEGYEFKGWEGDINRNGSEIEITVYDDKEIVAVFEKITGDISVSDLEIVMDGYEASITADVEVTGDEKFLLPLKVNGELIENITVMPGDEMLEYKHTFEESGEHSITLGEMEDTIVIEEETEDSILLGTGLTTVISTVLILMGYMFYKKDNE